MTLLSISRNAALACASLFVFHAMANAEQVYTNQVSAFDNKTVAYDLFEELSEDMSPVWVHYEGSSEYPWRVMVGHFEYFADAWTSTYHYDPAVIPQAIVKTIEVPEVKPNNLSLDYPITPEGFGSDSVSLMPETQTVELDSMYGAASLLGLAEIQDSRTSTMLDRQRPAAGKLDVALQSKDPATAATKFDEIVKTHGNEPEAFVAKCGKALNLMRSGKTKEAKDFLNSMVQSPDHAEKCFAMYLGGYADIYDEDRVNAIQKFDMVRQDKLAAEPIRNDAAIRHAYLVLKDQGYEAAAPVFRELCNNTELKPAQRLSAMEIYEGIAQTREKYATAWMVNNLIEKYSTDEEQIAKARMRRVGLAMEMSQRGLGSMDEVTELSEKLQHDTTVPESVKATNALMHAESLFHQRKYDEALAASQQIIETYQHIPRECMMAEVLEAACLISMDQHGAAQAKLRALASRQEQPGEKKFHRSDPRAKALYWLAFSHSNNGNSGKADEVLQELDTKFSDTFEHANARKRFKNSRVLTTPSEPRRR